MYAKRRWHAAGILARAATGNSRTVLVDIGWEDGDHEYEQSRCAQLTQRTGPATADGITKEVTKTAEE